MAEPGPVTRALLALARSDGDGAPPASICRAWVDGLDVDGAAISVLTASDARETLCASDGTATLLEELQYTLNEGACLRAATTGEPVLVPDLRASAEVDRWPVFAAALRERAEVRALFAFPLRWGTVTVGVLDLYRAAPGDLSPADRRDARTAADVAALMMLGAWTDPGAGGEIWWLDASLSDHQEVHQATGMVLVQLGVDTAEALSRLRGYAFARGRLLIDVAHDVVTRRLSFSEDTW